MCYGSIRLHVEIDKPLVCTQVRFTWNTVYYKIRHEAVCGSMKSKIDEAPSFSVPF